MIDDEKTSMLRDKIRSMQPEPDEKKEATNTLVKALAGLTLHIVQILFFWGAQSIVLNHAGVAPLGFWESFVVFEAAIIFLKK